MSKDSEFIKRPLTGILDKISLEISYLNAGFTTKHVLWYILDSAFLQITGALEQKVKCIYWELGNNSYDLRYDIINSKSKIGECSNYEDKNKVLKMLIEEIIAIKENRGYKDCCASIEQETYWKTSIGTIPIKQSIKKFYDNGMLEEYFLREYQEYEKIILDLDAKALIVDNKDIKKNEEDKIDIHLFYEKQCGKKNTIHYKKNKELEKIYNKAIKYRNRIAHNTKSTINNIPDFAELKDQYYKYEKNPFIRFAIILLVDRTFIDVFDQYEKARNDW